MTKTLAHHFANYACSLGFEDLSPEVVHEVKRRMIDSLGCALGAWNREPCVIARKVASDFSAKHGSPILGTTHKAPPDWAAWPQSCGITCAHTAIMPTNNEIDASAAASSTNIFNMTDSLEHKKNIVPPLF